MEISEQDSKKMCRLAQEGKQIAKIVEEDFPKLSYWDVYVEVYGSGQRSSLGIKKMISSRLNKLVDSKKGERRVIVNELQYLVWHLYENHKKNQSKLAKIRSALEE